MDIKRQLEKLIYQAPCESELEGEPGSCPDRKYGRCKQVERLDGCFIQGIVENLVAHGVTLATENNAVIRSKADRIRAMSDTEFVNRLYELHVLLSEYGHYELSELFCDGKAECAAGEDCSVDRVKVCILRWLQRPPEDGETVD